MVTNVEQISKYSCFKKNLGIVPIHTEKWTLTTTEQDKVLDTFINEHFSLLYKGVCKLYLHCFEKTIIKLWKCLFLKCV
jgi:hypothetical protein